MRDLIELQVTMSNSFDLLKRLRSASKKNHELKTLMNCCDSKRTLKKTETSKMDRNLLSTTRKSQLTHRDRKRDFVTLSNVKRHFLRGPQR